MYPQNELEKNQSPNEEQLAMVQHAVEAYQEKNQGILPIKTKDNDTPIFEKYLVDFSLLRESNTLQTIPGNAYENGGVYQYAILDPENNPQVKLIDLRMTEQIRSVHTKLNIYRNKHLYPPFGDKIEGNIFQIDFKKLGLKQAPYVTSPYTKNNLPIIMDVEGNLFVDYRIDLNQAIKDFENPYETGDDIRYIIAENTPFLPAYSFPYTIKDGEPVFMKK